MTAQIVTDQGPGLGYSSNTMSTGEAQIVGIGRPTDSQPQAPAASPAPQGQQMDPQQLAQFAQQLQQLQQPQPQYNPYQQPQYNPQPNNYQPPQAQPQAPQIPVSDEFKQQLSQVLGIPPEQATQGLQRLAQLEQYVAQQQQQQTLQSLQQEWGPQFDTIMPQVAQRFNQLPPQMKAGLDNLEGARMIHALLQYEQQLQQPQVPGSQPPRYDRAQPQPLPGVGGQKPTFKRSQLMTMSDADYAQNSQAIQYAYQNGLVQDDL